MCFQGQNRKGWNASTPPEYLIKASGFGRERRLMEKTGVCV